MGGRVAAINKPAFEETLRTTFNGRDYSQQIWGNTDELAIKLKEVFKQAFIRGDGPQEMARAIRKEFNVACSRAETLVRTDGTAIMVRGTIKRYQDEGLKYYRVLVKLDERTTDICRGIAHENKLYLLDEAVAGVTAPPFHYNCRSTIMPDEGELNGEREAEAEKDSLSELFKADLDVIRQESYVERFKNNPLTAPIGEQLASVARKMIQHRDGTPFEDYYLLDANTGKIVAVSNKSRRNKGVVYNDQVRKAFKESSENGLVSIHNHPSGYPPSLSDLASLQQRNKNNSIQYGITAGHDGSIYWYNKPHKRIPKIFRERYEFQIDKFKKMGYNEVVAQEKTLEVLSDIFDFDFGRID